MWQWFSDWGLKPSPLALSRRAVYKTLHFDKPDSRLFTKFYNPRARLGDILGPDAIPGSTKDLTSINRTPPPPLQAGLVFSCSQK